MIDTLWSKFVLQLNKHNPFFACLALFTQVVPDEDTDIGISHGKDIRINPDFILHQSEEKAFSYLLHQVLHLALLHSSRGKGRDWEVWNIAADIVVNDIIVTSTDWPTAPATAWDKRFTDCSVEQVYARLMTEFKPQSLSQAGTDCNEESQSSGECVNGSDTSNHGDENDKDPDDAAAQSPDSSTTESDTNHDTDEDFSAAQDSSSPEESQGDATDTRSTTLGVEETPSSITKLYQSHSDLVSESGADSEQGDADDSQYWQLATYQARVATEKQNHSQISGALQREFERIDRNNIDWQRELWRFVSDRQADYTEFDVRHIHRGLYLEQLSVDGLNLSVAIDTSGSIDRRELSVFMTELEAIRRLYADVQVSLYYCDAEIDGPHQLHGKAMNTNPPMGYGGTSFQPVFDAIEKLPLADRPDCLIYFTDGEADFPAQSELLPTLWILTSDGNCEERDIPFGRSLRMKPIPIQ